MPKDKALTNTNDIVLKYQTLAKFFASEESSLEQNNLSKDEKTLKPSIPTNVQELSHPLQNESLEPEESNKNAIEVIDTILKYKQIEKDGGLKTLSLDERVEYGDAIKDLKYFQEDHFNENPEAKAASEVLTSLLDKDLNTLARKLDSKSNNPSNDKSSQKEQSKFSVYNVLLNTPLEAWDKMVKVNEKIDKRSTKPKVKQAISDFCNKVVNSFKNLADKGIKDKDISALKGAITTMDNSITFITQAPKENVKKHLSFVEKLNASRSQPTTKQR